MGLRKNTIGGWEVPRGYFPPCDDILILVRDLTKAGSIPKSEASRRIKNLGDERLKDFAMQIRSATGFHPLFAGEPFEELCDIISKELLKSLKNNI